jgi:hypothetical protein
MRTEALSPEFSLAFAALNEEFRAFFDLMRDEIRLFRKDSCFAERAFPAFKGMLVKLIVAELLRTSITRYHHFFKDRNEKPVRGFKVGIILFATQSLISLRITTFPA